MGKIAFVFPGQGSQTTGMGKAVFDQYEAAAAYFRTADERLGYPLSEIMFEGPQEKLTRTANAQPALLTAGIALWKLIDEAGITADYTAGHSLGEYTALAASGAISFDDAVYAVHKRGELMEEAVPNGEGTMAAVLGLDREVLQEVTAEITEAGDPVQLANLNCPGQIVISGTVAGVGKAGALAKEKGAKRVLPLQVSGPFHSSLMEPAAEKFRGILGKITVRDASIPVIANVSGEPVKEAEAIREGLIEQLYSPVLWEDSVTRLIGLGVDTFIEIGPGKVLSGLIRKIDRNVRTYSVSDGESLAAAIEGIKEGSA